MPVILALPHIYDCVVARFIEDAADVEHAFGWREPHQHRRAGARIVWVPGDPSGELGELRPPRSPRGNPRSLATLAERFTVYLSATNAAQPEDERASYQATRELYDAWVRAVHHAAPGAFRVRSQAWNVDKKERRHGAELIVVGEVDAMVPDTSYALVQASADVTVDLAGASA